MIAVSLVLLTGLIGQAADGAPIPGLRSASVPTKKTLTSLCVHKDRLWIGTDGDGLFFKPVTGYVPILKEPTNEMSSAKINCFGIYSDVLYAGTENGLFRWNDKGKTFELAKAFMSDGIELTNSRVSALPPRGKNLAALIEKGQADYMIVMDANEKVIFSKTDTGYSRLAYDANGVLLFGMHRNYGIDQYDTTEPANLKKNRVVNTLLNSELFARQANRFVFNFADAPDTLNPRNTKESLGVAPDGKDRKTVLDHRCRFGAMELDDAGTLWIGSNTGLWRLGQAETTPRLCLENRDIGPLAFAGGKLYFAHGKSVCWLGGIGSGTFNPTIKLKKQFEIRMAGNSEPISFLIDFGTEPQLLGEPPKLRLLKNGIPLDTGGLLVAPDPPEEYYFVSPPPLDSGSYSVEVAFRNIDDKESTIVIGSILWIVPWWFLYLSLTCLVVFLLMMVFLFPKWIAYSLHLGDWVVEVRGSELWIRGGRVRRIIRVRKDAQKQHHDAVLVSGSKKDFADPIFYSNCNKLRGIEFEEEAPLALSLRFQSSTKNEKSTFSPAIRKRLENKGRGQFTLALVGAMRSILGDKDKASVEDSNIAKCIADYCAITQGYRWSTVPSTIFELFAEIANLSKNAKRLELTDSDPLISLKHALLHADIVFVASHGTHDTLHLQPNGHISKSDLETWLHSHQEKLQAKLVVFCSCLVGIEFIKPLLDAGITCIAGREKLHYDFLIFYGCELLHGLLSHHRDSTGTLAGAHRSAMKFMAENSSEAVNSKTMTTQRQRFADNANQVYIYGNALMIFQFRYLWS